ncbi:MAG: FtsX-like permease family protein [Oscillospiraceae bacterium]|nr:FtsX-like permease family protein [Oscillospiraceae bacterium]
MKRNIMRKNLRQTIWKSLGRYIAIVAIIALGSAMFVGLLTTKSDMMATTQKFTDDTNMFDLRLLCTYGWTENEVEQVRQMAGVECAEGSNTLDVIGMPFEGEEEMVYRLHSLPKQVSKVHLLGGRLPQNPDECLMDGSHADDSMLGKKFIVSENNDASTLESMNYTSFTIVGYVSTPLYMDMSRGNTSLGSGNLASYVYIPREALAVDYYTEIGVTLSGDFENYTDAFTAAMENMAQQLEPGVTLLAQERYQALKDEAELEYADGLREYDKGFTQYDMAKREALDALFQALKELEDGQAEIDANWVTINEGQAQLDEAQAELEANASLLATSRQELLDAKAEAYRQFAAAYAELSTNQKEASAGLKQVQDGLVQLDDGIAQLEVGLAQIADGLEKLELVISVLEPSVEATQSVLDLAYGSLVRDETLIGKLEAQLSDLQGQLDEYTEQRQELLDMQTQYSGQLPELKTQRHSLAEMEKTLLDGLAAIEQGLTELGLKQAQAENEFAAAEAQINSGESQLANGRAELDAKQLELDAGKAALEQAQLELDAGRAEYDAGKAEAEAEFAAAEAELRNAKIKLEEARQTIDDMAEPATFILDRNTNVGYLAVNSNSDIVAGVARVFPAFFLLVAALVCITTMTRMVEEERTQIGVLKALGYKNSAIINKYLVYSGSAAVLGCGLGVIVGSIVFPKILWFAYSIILNITPDIVLGFDWPLCILVVVAYTLVSMLVTWYCCRRSLKEVPAELMRPKAPTAGKKILLEYLPFWNKIGFLNKVMFRNVFRYRQRLLMMMVGIGGCTALLLTGFGFRDSIMDIVNYQFAEVTVYDMEIYFSEGQTEEQQMAFRDELRLDVEEVLFFYQASVDLEYEDKTREVFLMSADERIGEFIDFHRDGTDLTMPGPGEVYLTVGAAEAMGIQEGDTVTLRDAEMRTLTLKVAGIFENYVYNFAIIQPETLAQQWGQVPSSQMAYVTVGDGQDVHAAGAKISGMDGVMNVSISQDLANQVGSMLEALDLVVVTIVICAGLLAAIVLYNLTNISITERVREIATIKVLGFNSKESALYVFKENLFLSVMGAGIGLIGGIYLLKFVMSQIKIDMVWFTDRLTPWSFVWAVLLTMLSAVIVDCLLYFKLEKINMAEALKSVE